MLQLTCSPLGSARCHPRLIAEFAASSDAPLHVYHSVCGVRGGVRTVGVVVAANLDGVCVRACVRALGKPLLLLRVKLDLVRASLLPP